MYYCSGHKNFPLDLFPYLTFRNIFFPLHWIFMHICKIWTQKQCVCVELIFLLALFKMCSTYTMLFTTFHCHIVFFKCDLFFPHLRNKTPQTSLCDDQHASSKKCCGHAGLWLRYDSTQPFAANHQSQCLYFLLITLTYSLIDSAALIRLEIGKTAAGLRGKNCLSLSCHEYRIHRWLMMAPSCLLRYLGCSGVCFSHSRGHGLPWPNSISPFLEEG